MWRQPVRLKGTRPASNEGSNDLTMDSRDSIINLVPEVSPNELLEVIKAAKNGKLRAHGMGLLCVLRTDALEHFLCVRMRKVRNASRNSGLNLATVETILRMGLEGISSRRIAQRLGIAVRTAQWLWRQFLEESCRVIPELLRPRLAWEREALELQCDESHGRRWRNGKTLLLREEDASGRPVGKPRHVPVSNYRAEICGSCAAKRW